VDPTDAQPSHVRASLNQARFRELNETSLEAALHGGVFAEFVCECTRESCDARVSLTVEEYEQVRRSPSRFVLAVGHASTVDERVVDSTARFEIVEKVGDAAKLAELLDRRSLEGDDPL
jgi:hypothetical protein